MKSARTAHKTMHRARPAAEGEKENEEVKIAYVEFIDKLMRQMRMDSIERMLEAALRETETSEKHAGG